MSQTIKNLLAGAIVVTFMLVILGIEALCDLRPGLFKRLWVWTAIVCVAAAAVMLSLHLAQAHDDGQWSDSALRDWYQGLMQPDNPNASCCGEADAYWADEIHVRDGKTFATVTDDRPDEPRRRPHVDIGTEFEIPNHKLKWDRANPTGHGVLFISRQGYVYCFVQPGGV
jgi:hypothetical protein